MSKRLKSPIYPDAFGHLYEIPRNSGIASGKLFGFETGWGNSMTDEISLEERKVIYRARRGLKELDVYFDPYVKNYYLSAEPFEKEMFAELVAQEDPDLLDWFMEVSEPPRPELKAFILKLKFYVHG